ncbi:hypothetical protein GTW49_09635 [Streptomyces sp. SID4925]|nr:hypothetical protein [Streptomyces sp. SID4925]
MRDAPALARPGPGPCTRRAHPCPYRRTTVRCPPNHSMLRDNGAWCRLEAEGEAEGAFTVHVGGPNYERMGNRHRTTDPRNDEDPARSCDRTGSRHHS